MSNLIPKPTNQVKHPNFKIGYFRIKDAPVVTEPGLVPLNSVSSTVEPVLEVGLVPYDDSAEEVVNNEGGLFKLPPGTKVLKIRSGDFWPDGGHIRRFMDHVFAGIDEKGEAVVKDSVTVVTRKSVFDSEIVKIFSSESTQSPEEYVKRRFPEAVRTEKGWEKDNYIVSIETHFLD